MTEPVAVAFRTPTRAEMAVRQRWLGDPTFMSYNAGWDIDVPAHHADTGCVDFPPETWSAWYDAWIGGPDRAYWFVEDADGQVVGHAHYHLAPDANGLRIAHIGASIHPDHRGLGLGAATFAELVRRVRASGAADVAENGFESTRTAAVRVHLALGFLPVGEEGAGTARPVTTYRLTLEPAPPARL